MILLYAFLCSLFFCHDGKQYEALLGHPEFAVREFATWQLDHTGYESYEVLVLLTNSQDPEVRMRSEEIFSKKHRQLNKSVVKYIQESPSLEALLFYFEPGDVGVSQKFAKRVIENPKLAREILYWGSMLGVLSKDEIFYFDPIYIANGTITKENAEYYATGGLCAIRCRAIGKPTANDPKRGFHKDRKPLFQKGMKPYFPLVDIH